MQVFFNMDKMVRTDFEAGLANLKPSPTIGDVAQQASRRLSTARMTITGTLPTLVSMWYRSFRAMRS
jgi:hypothetical protein